MKYKSQSHCCDKGRVEHLVLLINQQGFFIYWFSRNNVNWMLVLNPLKSRSSLHWVNAHLKFTIVWVSVTVPLQLLWLLSKWDFLMPDRVSTFTPVVVFLYCNLRCTIAERFQTQLQTELRSVSNAYRESIKMLLVSVMFCHPNLLHNIKLKKKTFRPPL